MISISKKMEYAFMVLKCMGEGCPGEIFTARALCEKNNAPFDTVAKAMQSMGIAKILKSSKGTGGGYTLNCDLEKIKYTELATIIEDDLSTARCESEQKRCNNIKSCTIKDAMTRLNRLSLEFFSSLSVADILGTNSKVRDGRRL